ncbi:hypothetical protein GARCT_02589 [Geobacillus sp. 12AMOR1]|nr:hypothetical protein GARCT_02589 [Geobacillus sp. 12AMOR1]
MKVTIIKGPQWQKSLEDAYRYLARVLPDELQKKEVNTSAKEPTPQRV